MSRPGVEVSVVDSAPPPSIPTDTGVLFVVGKTEYGPNSPLLVRSMKAYGAAFGAREGYVDAYDVADVFFREGGAKLYVQRYGPEAAVTEADVPDGTVSEVLAWVGNDAERAAVAKDKEEGEAVPRATLIAQLDAIIAEGPPADPTAATTVADALARLDKALGPGQVIVADDDTSADELLTHVAGHNRVALIDGVGDTESELAAEADALRGPEGRWGGMFAPAAICPGTVPGTSRTVKFSAIAAGLMARSDRAGNPNVAAAGANGQAAYATDLLQRFTDDEYAALNEAGVNMARLIYGSVRLYGYRTLADPATEPQWVALNHARLTMGIVAEAEQAGEHYVFGQIDGRGHLIAEFGSQLAGMLNRYYVAGALYGEEASDAYSVDVGPAVNTPETIAAGELHATLRVRMSPMAEHVLIEIVKVPSTEALPTAA